MISAMTNSKMAPIMSMGEANAPVRYSNPDMIVRIAIIVMTNGLFAVDSLSDDTIESLIL